MDSSSCIECGRTLIPQRQWLALSEDVRALAKADNKARQATSVRCTACARRLTRLDRRRRDRQERGLPLDDEGTISGGATRQYFTCKRCGKGLVTQRAWSQMTPEQREESAAAGFVRQGLGSHCKRCARTVLAQKKAKNG